jgi:hypothetical protein
VTARANYRVIRLKAHVSTCGSSARRGAAGCPGGTLSSRWCLSTPKHFAVRVLPEALCCLMLEVRATMLDGADERNTD